MEAGARNKDYASILAETFAIYPGGLGTALSAASSLGHIGIGKLHLERVYNISRSGDDYQVAILAAAWQGHAQIVRLLLRSLKMWTLLCFVISPYKKLLKLGSESCPPELDNGTVADIHDCCTVYDIHKAASLGHYDVLELHLARVAMQAFVRKSNSPLHKAAEGGFLKSVKLIIDHGAYVDGETRPLAFAGKRGHAHMVLFLLGRGAAVNVEGIGSLALTIAASSSHEAVVRFLAERRVSVDRNNVVKDPHQLLVR